MQSRTANVAVASVLASLLWGCSLETSGLGTSEDLSGGNTEPPPPDDATGGGGTDPVTGDAGTPVVGSDGAVMAPPTTTGSCTPGHYTGMYECMSNQQGPFGLSATSVSGAVSFDLIAQSGSSTFAIMNGSFEANPTALQSISATLQGTLNCGSPFSGKLVNGMSMQLLSLTTAFTGNVSATYDTKLREFVQGAMTIPTSSSTAGCLGTWTATLSASSGSSGTGSSGTGSSGTGTGSSGTGSNSKGSGS